MKNQEIRKKCKIMFLFVVLTLSTSFAFAGRDMMWARFDKVETQIWGLNKFDHVCAVVNNNGKMEAYGYFGRKSVNMGNYLEGTYGQGSYKHLKCVATRPQNCKLIYYFEGVCHQDVNRLLFSSGKKVTNATGYWFFYAHYGHYSHPSFFYRWNRCKNDCK